MRTLFTQNFVYMIRSRVPGVNFTNVLQAAFTHAEPKSAIKLLSLTVFFELLGSAHVKAAQRTLVKLTPDCHQLLAFSSELFSSNELLDFLKKETRIFLQLFSSNLKLIWIETTVSLFTHPIRHVCTKFILWVWPGEEHFWLLSRCNLKQSKNFQLTHFNDFTLSWIYK